MEKKHKLNEKAEQKRMEKLQRVEQEVKSG